MLHGSLDGLWGTTYSDITRSCIDILDTMITQGMVSDFYVSFLQFSQASNSATNEIGYIRNASELPAFKSVLQSKYGHGVGAGTYYSLGFKKAQEIISRDLLSRNNQRVIVFMTDGLPNDSGGLAELTDLKNNYGVDAFYAIAFDLPNYSVPLNTAILERQADIFKPNSEVLRATNSTLTETFKNILYQINALEPETEKSIDGRFRFSDIEIATEKPLEIIVEKFGVVIKQIKITSYPTESEGVVYIKDGGMYLSLEKLAEACGLEDLNGTKVSISYFVNT